MPTIRNFGRNLCFRPGHFYTPRTDDEILAILDRHQDEKIRVVASRHSWSPLIETDDVLVDMGRYEHVEIHEKSGETLVTVGAGCQVKRLLGQLNKRGLTLPSVGLVTEQTIAGATATGTHGSGKHSLSHYIRSVRIACYDGTGQSPQIVEVDGGPQLLAARCSLGCLGIILEVTLPCIPQYYIEEQATKCENLDQALALEQHSPLQQFFLIPYCWRYIVQQRRVSIESRRSRLAPLYRVYWFLSLDLGMHLLIKLFASLLRSRRLVHMLFRRIVQSTAIEGWRVVDRSDRQLVMEHELFRHLELEAFVRREHVAGAAAFVADVLKLADDPNRELSPQVVDCLQRVDMMEEVDAIRGVYTHHYPICFRRIQNDDTLISMASDCPHDCYAISFITYTEPRDRFYRLMDFMATCLFRLYNARIHWGKWFPLPGEIVAEQYPRLGEFREVCERFDPRGVFRNEFVNERLGFKADSQ